MPRATYVYRKLQDGVRPYMIPLIVLILRNLILSDDYCPPIILALLQLLLPQKMKHPVIPDSKINFDRLPASPESLFRFSVIQLVELVGALRMPDIMVTTSRDSSYSLEVLAIVLRRLARPCNMDDLIPLFGRSRAALTRIFHMGIRFISPHQCFTIAFLKKKFKDIC
jgi:hypothetical protein